MQQQFIRFPQTQYHFPAGMAVDKIRRIIQTDNSLMSANNPALRRYSVLPEPVTVMVELPVPNRTGPARTKPPVNNPRKRKQPAKT